MSTLFQKFFHIFKTLFFLAIIKNRALMLLRASSSISYFLWLSVRPRAAFFIKQKAGQRKIPCPAFLVLS